MSDLTTEFTSYNKSVCSRTLQVYDYVIPTIGFFAIIVNLAIVISSGLILKKGRETRPTYILLGNVALSDFLTALSTVFGQVFPREYREHYICSVQVGMIVGANLVSILSVGLIAIDRYVYIIHSLKYQQWIYGSRIRFAIIIIWILGLSIGFLPLMGWYGDTDNGRKCWFILLAPRGLILLTVAMGTIPIITVAVLYTTILIKALKNIRQLEKNPMENQNDKEKKLRVFIGTQCASEVPKSPKKWKAIKVVLFTTAAFIFTWGPYFIACTIYVLIESDTETAEILSELIASPFAILGFVNVLVDPIIYAWWHKGFRTFIFKKYYRPNKKKGSSSGNLMTSRHTPSISQQVSNREMEVVLSQSVAPP